MFHYRPCIRDGEKLCCLLETIQNFISKLAHNITIISKFDPKILQIDVATYFWFIIKPLKN